MTRQTLFTFLVFFPMIFCLTVFGAFAQPVARDAVLRGICGTWVNTEYKGDKTHPQKIILRQDGTFETFTLASHKSPAERGDFYILERWRDASGFTFCKAVTKSLMSSVATRELWRLDTSGRKWESCFTFISKLFPDKMDSTPDPSGPFQYSVYFRSPDPPHVSAEGSAEKADYSRYVYATMEGKPLRVYVFQPVRRKGNKRLPAIVFFHGGGWVSGEPAWAFELARHFSSLGMVAAAVQYRLSDQIQITPLEAMADTRASIRWLRSNAKQLGIDVNRIAAYGWSAGAHLAASAAVFKDADGMEKASSSPNALILVSPAVHLDNETWLQQLLGGRADNLSVSPSEHVRQGLPPTLILEGRHDTITPLKDVQVFFDRMRAAGNRCDLQVYEGVGHLFTPDGISDRGDPQPDKRIKADALRKADEFLAGLGFIQ